jgi:cell division protein FtsB
VERLRRKKNFSKSEKKEIARKMVKAYEKISAVNDELTQNLSLLKDGTN